MCKAAVAWDSGCLMEEAPSLPMSGRLGQRVIFTDNNTPRQFLSQEKWDRLKASLLWISTLMANPLGIEHKALQSHHGYLVHAMLTYGFLCPYLKGVHLSVDGWRSNRDEDGWAVVDGFVPQENYEEAPIRVMPVPRLAPTLKP